MYRKEIMKYPNVVGVSNTMKWKIKDGKVTDIGCIRIYVSQKLPIIMLPKESIIPKEINGIPTDVVEIGELRSLSKQGSVSPLCSGISIGHKDITAGTLGWFYERADVDVIGSNAHVFTPDASKPSGSFKGDAILQPGPHDGGVEKIGEYIWHKQVKPSSLSSCRFSNGIVSVLNGFSNLLKRKSRFHVTVEEVNNIDFAVCTLEANAELRCFDFNPVDLGYPIVGHVFAGSEQVGIICKMQYIVQEGWSPVGVRIDYVDVDDTLRKSGRTSCDTAFKVTDESAYLNVSYGNFMATFDDVIVVDNLKTIQGGDSGSAAFKVDI